MKRCRKWIEGLKRGQRYRRTRLYKLGMEIQILNDRWMLNLPSMDEVAFYEGDIEEDIREVRAFPMDTRSGSLGSKFVYTPPANKSKENEIETLKADWEIDPRSLGSKFVWTNPKYRNENEINVDSDM